MIVPIEAYELSGWASRLGAEDPLPYLRGLALIDTDAIREVGERVWGVTYRGGPVGDALVVAGHRLWGDLLTQLRPAWEMSAGYEPIAQQLQVIRDALDDEAARIPIVGQVLVDIADAFEVQWYEVVTWVVTALAFIVAIVGLFAASTVVGVVVAVIALVIAAAGALAAFWNTTRPRLAMLASSSSRISGMASPASGVDDLQVPDAVERWDEVRRWRPR